MDFGLDQADKIASVVGATAAVIALFFTIRAARGQGNTSSRTGSGPIWLVAGLAVVGLCALSSWGLGAASKLGVSGAGPSNGPTPTASRSGRPVAPAEPSAAQVLWKGEVRLDATPRDFDHEPPARGNTSTDLSSDGYLHGSVYDKFWGRAVVLWPGTTAPSRGDCAERLQTHGVKRVTIDARSRICLETNQGRIVFIQVLRRDGDGYEARATLWSSS
ncbi:hypothetical protein AB0K04_08580 [Micromonospora coxensis]|uniref:hypothetical protein n=1 Tax=Micromonospora coxensis TaxID=356852 RepID=UPI00343316E6